MCVLFVFVFVFFLLFACLIDVVFASAEHKLEYVPAEISCSVEDLGQEFCDVVLGREGVSPDEMAVHLFNYLHVASALGSPAVVHDKDEL